MAIEIGPEVVQFPSPVINFSILTVVSFIGCVLSSRKLGIQIGVAHTGAYNFTLISGKG